MIVNQLYCHLDHLYDTVIIFLMFWHNYFCFPLDYAGYSALSTYALFVSLIQLVNGTYYLMIACLLILSVCLATASVPGPIIAIVSFTIICIHNCSYSDMTLKLHFLTFFERFCYKFYAHNHLLQPIFCLGFEWLISRVIE